MNSEDSAFHAEAEPVNRRLELRLSNHSFSHGFFSRRLREAHREMDRALAVGEYEEFAGVIMDSACNRSSMMSLKQYKVYCNEFGAVAHIDTAKSKQINGIASNKVKAIGSAIVPIPFPGIGITVEVEFFITESDTPTLLSLRDMKENALDLRVLYDRIDHGGRSQKLHFIGGFLIHKWQPNETDYGLFTEADLRKLHRSFGHPSASSLTSLLKRARPDEFDASVREAIEEITSSCVPCQFHSRKPRRFKLAVGTEDLRFNHTVAVDVMYLDGSPVLHIVDEATHFMSACFLRNVSSREIWSAICRCWVIVYLGPPDFLRVDQGSSLVSAELKGAATGMDISILEAPVESPSTM